MLHKPATSETRQRLLGGLPILFAVTASFAEIDAGMLG